MATIGPVPAARAAPRRSEHRHASSQTPSSAGDGEERKESSEKRGPVYDRASAASESENNADIDFRE